MQTLLSCKQFIRLVDTAVNNKMFGQKYGPRNRTEIRSEKNDIGKTARREVSSPESETMRKGSKSGAPAEIGRYLMYALDISRDTTLIDCKCLFLFLNQYAGARKKKMPIWTKNLKVLCCTVLYLAEKTMC